MNNLISYLTHETSSEISIRDWHPYYGYFDKKGNWVDMYVGKYMGARDVSIIIADIRSKSKKSKFGEVNEWYLGVVNEERPQVSPENIEKFNQKASKIIARKNRIAGKNIESAVLKAIEEIRTKALASISS